MRDGVTIELDEKTLGNLGELAKEAGMNDGEYLRKLLLDRAATHLKRHEAGRSFFCVENGGVPPEVSSKRVCATPKRKRSTSHKQK